MNSVQNTIDIINANLEAVVELEALVCEELEALGYDPSVDELEELRELEAAEDAGRLSRWLDDQAARCRAAAGDDDRHLWLADLIQRVARLAELTQASSGDELDARVCALEASQCFRLEPARSSDRYYPGWDLRDADGRLLGFFGELEPARAALEKFRSLPAVLS